MKRLLTICSLLFSLSCFGQIDIQRTVRGSNLDLGRAMPWTGSGYSGNVDSSGRPIPNFNNNFVVGVVDPDTGVCLYVSNNDASSHTFNIAISQSGDVQATTFTGNTGRWQLLQTNFSTGVGASSTAITYFKTSGAARVAVALSGGSGSNTADVYIVLTKSGGCALIAPLNTFGDLEATSYYNSQAFFFANTVTTPTAGQVILSIVQNSPQRTVFFDYMIISCAATCIENVNVTGTAGSGCTGGTSSSLTSPNVVSTSTVQFGCSVAPGPTAGSPITIQLAANTPFIIPLKGYYAKPGGTAGVDLTSGAFTGQLNAQIYWHEK